MGSDETIVNSARVSFNKEASQYSTDRNEGLIKFLARNDHWSPFSHPMIMMRETVPIFVVRQRFKHFVGFNTSECDNDHEGLGMTYNEVSRRYDDSEPTFYVPAQWRKAAENVKQGSSDEEILGFEHDPHWVGSHCNGNLKLIYDQYIALSSEFYAMMLDHEVAPEMARMVLPQSMNTSYYVTGSLAAWARAYKLRIDSHAQKEIQILASQWNEIIRPLFPVAWPALVDGEKNGPV